MTAAIPPAPACRATPQRGQSPHRRSDTAHARRQAALAVRDVIHSGHSLDRALEHHETTVAASERGLFRELTYGTLRWHARLQPLAAARLVRPLRHRDADLAALLAVGVYQLTMTRIPPHAAVAETVQAAAGLGKTWAMPMLNAVLRGIARAGPAPRPAADAERHALPAWLYQRIAVAWPAQVEPICQASNARPPLTLRVNLRRQSRQAYLDTLAECGMAAAPTLHSAAGVVLAQPVAVDAVPGFTTGEVSVQDEAAQLAASALGVRPGHAVLDACAAPGGKTCHLLDLEPDLARLVAVDRPERLALLTANLRRLDLAAELIGADAATPDDWWDGQRFDRILLDAPCSGTGVLRRHPDIRHRRMEADIERFAATQRRLLETCWSMLQPGGKLLYVTCSILPEENQIVAGHFLDTQLDARAVPLAAHYGITAGAGRQRLPGIDDGDGFFYACLERTV